MKLVDITTVTIKGNDPAQIGLGVIFVRDDGGMIVGHRVDHQHIREGVDWLEASGRFDALAMLPYFVADEQAFFNKNGMRVAPKEVDWSAEWHFTDPKVAMLFKLRFGGAA